MSIIAKGIKGLFGGGNNVATPKPPTPPPPPPATPTRADAGGTTHRASNVGVASLITTGATGLQKKATTGKKTLLGGGS